MHITGKKETSKKFQIKCMVDLNIRGAQCREINYVVERFIKSTVVGRGSICFSLLCYRTLAIITRSWFETALDYKPYISLKNLLLIINHSEKWGKNYTSPAYNGARTLINFLVQTLQCTDSLFHILLPLKI